MDETLIKQVAESTGLGTDKVETILKEWIQSTGKSPQNLGLEDFREVLVEILQNLFSEVASGENQFIRISR